MTKEELEALTIPLPNRQIAEEVKQVWDHIAKPLDGLGRWEGMFAQIGAIQETIHIDISKKAVIVMCADNGIVEEGISQSPQEVTAAVAASMAKGGSSVCKMAASLGADVKVVDIGINKNQNINGLLQKKVCLGTNNFLKQPALLEEHTLKAIETGIEIVKECKEQGYQILATGEMGIGNTTTSSAVTAALLGCPVEKVVGRGAGLSDAGLTKKKQVIQEALEKYQLKDAEPLNILSTVGGLDIAGLTGVCIGGALCKIPIVLDGAISAAAALLTQRIVPGVNQYLLPSHESREPAGRLLLEELFNSSKYHKNICHPIIHADMALGEGTGAVMLLSLLDMVMAVYQGSTSFRNIGIKQYDRFE